MNNLNKLALRARAKLSEAFTKTTAKLAENSGISTSTEHLLWALGAIVIVGVIITAVVTLTKDTILPEWGNKMLEILNLGK